MTPPDDPAFVSMAFDDMPVPDFADVVVESLPASTHAIPADPEWWARAVFSVRSAPWWVKLLLAIRQAVVGLVGIRRADSDVFAVSSVRGEEALIAADDTHLDFRAAVGVDVARRMIRVTTAVKLHGWRGRLYFVPVSILHGPVTRSMVKAAVRRHLAGSSS
jgi:hypothetical protein